MIFGLNFNGTNIPNSVVGPKRMPLYRIGFVDAEEQKRRKFNLQGVCQYPHEADQMVQQADNGHREILTYGPVSIEGVEWWGIYIF